MYNKVDTIYNIHNTYKYMFYLRHVLHTSSLNLSRP